MSAYAVPMVITQPDGATGNRNVTAAVPKGTKAGDRVVLAVGIIDSASSVDGTGWTVLKNGPVTGTLKNYLLTRIYADVDGASYTIPVVNTTAVVIGGVVIKGGNNAIAVLVGADGTRAASGAGAATTAPSITAATADTLVLAVAMERSNTNEKAAPIGVNNGFAMITVQANLVDNVAPNSLAIATKVVAAGAVGDTTFTYPNSQAANGYAVLLGIQSAVGAENPKGFKDIAQMLRTPGFTIGHRGGSIDFPEMSALAYRALKAFGYGAAEASFQRSVDGTWVGHHDLDMTRVTANPAFTEDIRTLTAATILARLNLLGTNGAAQPIMTWAQFVALFASEEYVVFLDPKNSAAGAGNLEFINMAKAAFGTDRWVYKWAGKGGFELGLPQAAKLAGVTTWGYFYESDYTDGSLAAMHGPWDLIGMDYSASPAAWAAAVAIGKPVIGHIAGSLANYTTAMSRGARGVMVSGVRDVPAIGRADVPNLPADISKLSYQDAERAYLLRVSGLPVTTAQSELHRAVYGSNEHAYFAARSGLAKGSLNDHRVAYYRSTLGVTGGGLSDLARAFFARELA